MADQKPVILMVTDRGDSLRRRISLLVEPQGFQLQHMRPSRNLLHGLRLAHPRLAVIASERESNWDCVGAISRIREHDPVIPLILISARSSEDQAVAAFRAGVTDYVKSSCTDEDLFLRIRHSLNRPHATSWRVNDRTPRKDTIDLRLVGQTPVMCELKEYVHAAARTDVNVMITGETGTGKELVAQLIHRYSHRCNGRLISINCAGLPETLLESELFGYERGAFTGANASYEGKLMLAENGTVFFDEIGDMGLVAQAKILRVIESKALFRLGGRREISLDFRVVAATNQHLERMVADGDFRKDLYYRLNVARIQVPPLREHKEDIPLLARHLLQEINETFGTDAMSVHDQAMELFVRYWWPGNVRELRNVLESALINRPSSMIQLSDLPKAFLSMVNDPTRVSSKDEQERDALLAALLSCNWNKSRAAEELNWSRMTLYRKLHKHRLTGLSP